MIGETTVRYYCQRNRSARILILIFEIEFERGHLSFSWSFLCLFVCFINIVIKPNAIGYAAQVATI